MKSTNIKNVTVSYDECVELEEVIATTNYYIDKLYPKVLDWLEIVRYPYDESMIDCRYHCKDGNFDRLRRITGYLVGTLDRWNDGKRAEEKDRVKHEYVMEGLE